MTVQPITPDEAYDHYWETFPDEVISTFNDLIKENWTPSSRTATFQQKEVLDRLAKLGLDVDRIIERQWLDVELIFQEVGWEVEYHSPTYDEDFEPTFVFTAPRGSDEVG